LLLQAANRALLLALDKAGKSKLASKAMIATTTKSSIRVKAGEVRLRDKQPLVVR
jgi:hypothetical protein